MFDMSSNNAKFFLNPLTLLQNSAKVIKSFEEITSQRHARQRSGAIDCEPRPYTSVLIPSPSWLPE